MIRNYFKTALRYFSKKRLYTFINILGLSVALTFVIISILYYNYERSYDSFHTNKANIFRITTTYTDNITGQVQEGAGTAQVQGPAFKVQVPEIKDYVRLYGGDIIENVKTKDKAFNLGAGFADPGFFKVFSFPLLFGDKNTVLNNLHSVVISEKTALKFFGKTDVIGERLDIEDTRDSMFASFMITGVAKNPPHNSSIQFDLLLPFAYLQTMFDDKTWLNNYLPTFVVIHPTADLKKIERKFVAVHNVHAKEQLQDGIKTGSFNKQTFYHLQPLTHIHLSREGGFANASKPFYSYFLLGISLFILLMASVNFINLSIATSLKRAKEIGIRKITGSSKMQIIWQFLLEASIICFTAFCIAMLFTQNLLPFFNRIAGTHIGFQTSFNPTILLYFIALLFLNIMLAGLYPAVILAKFKPTAVLYNKPALLSRNWLGKSLVVLQFVIAICLIVGSIVYYRQMNFVRTKDLGYNPYNIIRINIPPKREMKNIFSYFRNELSKEPGIKMISLTEHNNGSTIHLGDKVITGTYRLTDKTYLPMLGISLQQGRNFSDLYGTDSANAVIVNEAFVRTAGLKDPVGSTVELKDWFPKKATIIGVVKDYHQQSLKAIIQPEIIAMHDMSQASTVLIKIDKRRQKEAIAAIERVYKTIIPHAEFDFSFWDELNAKQYHQEQVWQQIVNIATILSILICCLGLFGLTHLAAHMRTKEIGIRKVLGATINSITSLISKDFIKLVLIAVVVATPLAWYMATAWLQHFAYRTTMSAWIFVGAAGIAVFIALMAIAFHAVKAARTNPVKSLRSE